MNTFFSFFNNGVEYRVGFQHLLPLYESKVELKSGDILYGYVDEHDSVVLFKNSYNNQFIYKSDIKSIDKQARVVLGGMTVCWIADSLGRVYSQVTHVSPKDKYDRKLGRLLSFYRTLLYSNIEVTGNGISDVMRGFIARNNQLYVDTYIWSEGFFRMVNPKVVKEISSISLGFLNAYLPGGKQ